MYLIGKALRWALGGRGRPLDKSRSRKLKKEK